MNSDKADDGNELRDLSIAPSSGNPGSTRGKDLQWTAGEHAGEFILELAAVDENDIYTAISKGRFSQEQAKHLRDEIDRVLESK